MSAYWFVLVGLCNHVCLCLTQPYTYSMYIIYIYGCLTLAFVFWLTGLTPPLHLVAKKKTRFESVGFLLVAASDAIWWNFGISHRLQQAECLLPTSTWGARKSCTLAGLLSEWLVVDLPDPSEKYDFVNWDYCSQYKKCSKPPTRLVSKQVTKSMFSVTDSKNARIPKGVKGWFYWRS